YQLFFQTIRGCDAHVRAFLLSNETDGVGRLVPEVYEVWDLHGIISHGKNGSPTTLPTQAGFCLITVLTRPQVEAHHHRIFSRISVVIGPVSDGSEAAFSVER